MKGSLFFDMLNLCIIFTILFVLLIFILTIDFSPKVQKVPITSVSADWYLKEINKNMFINITLKNNGETNVVLEPKIIYDKNLIKLDTELDTIVLKSNQTKNINLKFTAINGKFCDKGDIEIIKVIFVDIINKKSLELNIRYKIKKD